MRLVWDIPIYINKETESKLYNMLKSHNELVVELTQADWLRVCFFSLTAASAAGHSAGFWNKQVHQTQSVALGSLCSHRGDIA